MGLGLEASPEEIRIFLEEAEEQILTLEEGIIDLEKSSDELDTELLQAIFRAAHTLKGSSAALGHTGMAKLTHEMENLLDQLRKGTREVTPEFINLLLEGIDALRIYNEEIATDEESGYSPDELIEKLRLIGQSTSQAKKEVSATEESVQTAFFVPQLVNIALENAKAHGNKVFTIRALLNLENTLPAVRAYQILMLLEEKGTIIASDPTMQNIESELKDSEVKVLLVTGASKGEIEKELANVPDVRKIKIEEINKDAKPKQEIKTEASETEQVVEKPKEEAKDESRSEKKDKELTNIERKFKADSVISSTIRVDVEILDGLMNLVGELVIDRTRLVSEITQLHEAEDKTVPLENLSQTGAHIGRVTEQLQELIMKARMLPLETLFRKFPRMVRDLALKAGKEVELIMEGEETELDRSVIEQISDPLIHLLRNAIDHGLEDPEVREQAGKDKVGKIILSAEPEENYIVIRLRDDGKGIDPEKIARSAVKKGLISAEKANDLSVREAVDLIFMPGFSTSEKVTQVSGRGVGMDIVKKNIENLNGNIQVFTELGKGTEFRIELPLTLAIMRTLLVQSSENLFAIPLGSVAETHRINKKEIKYVNKRKAMTLRGNVLPLVHLEELFDMPIPENLTDNFFVVVVRVAQQQVGLIVQKLIGEEEVVIKTLSKLLGDTRGISGAAILGQGDVALILDVPSLISYDRSRKHLEVAGS
ncbi:MAG TPA: chemotaxis protein CheA [Firmicutes bacterium]|nr:chemotaxis protein CheA [Bacillota bacterium]